ncbi:MAG: DUF58 domain-containing protein [Gemmatimonadetes bacterium]|uniref:DUF58 domain-containing protein n=1 Tax=Candidatus Kutchimonas denitrificans TaxID=3056748 RepID=A0AAE4ZAA7_9BACT|nr:DUF58 domain-containing protein [Gemmatimonadota bacterium]NIR75567.1 DUF58 domain-containing protein [Candidatus Kutchimonas denitrificans]NIS01881.1 DUF58 domain-containing protein [Gemmatimonadota bacterium]NIT67662.1 DUF58 domain-containing protein [Gemmatimonadota bacterium]NIU53536.1 DUF58 domain-containing protein [Gemmatimonadota bacterium]
MPLDADRGQDRPDLLDPSELDALGGLEIIARAVVRGFISGLHASPARGFSVEFAEHRAYRPGDDLRFVDWKMYGRSDRFYLKQYEEETNLAAHICVDVSASMDWRSRPGLLTKLEYARRVAASLGLLLIRQGDLAGLICFAERVASSLPPRGTVAGWSELVRLLVEQPPGHLSAAAVALEDLAARKRRRGMVILVSDLLVEERATRRALRKLAHQGHEVLVFHLFDPGELELPGVGDALFVDPETGDELPASSAELRTDYREAVASAIDKWRRACGARGMDYHPITTDQPLGLCLGEYLHARARLG